MGERLIDDDDVEVRSFEEGDGFYDVLCGVDAARCAGEVADEICVFTVFVQDEDVNLLGKFVLNRNTFVLQEFTLALILRNISINRGTKSGLAPIYYIIFYPFKVKLF